MTLYKYLTPNLKVILNNLEIRFTQPEFFNDPFESFPFIQQIMTESVFDNLFASKFPEYNTDKFINESIANTLEENFHTLSLEQRVQVENNQQLINDLKLQLGDLASAMKQIFSQSSNSEWLKLSEKIKEKANNNFGIFCLTEKNDNLIMWSHYADSHRGFLIGFDSSHPFFDQKTSKSDTIRALKPIIYSNKRLPLTLLNENGSEEAAAEELISKFFYTKSTHWEAEREWRMILPLKDASKIVNEFYLFNVPPSAITEVILGCKMQQADKEEILLLVKNHNQFSHINIKEARLSYDAYSLSIIDL